jgi:NAD(P)-dependent dehydrogenase (short-subunit alcohol dehydrogenase family)
LYHATKWGIEGFIESAAQEVAPLGIDFIIVEPGPDGYQFRRLVRASPTDIYKNTPAGRIRPLEEYARWKNTPAGAMHRAIAVGSFVVKSDAGRKVDAMISAADSARPALRLAPGSTAYDSISHALAKRLAAIEAQRDVAFSADRGSD